jgi:hypothetical protein
MGTRTRKRKTVRAVDRRSHWSCRWLNRSFSNIAAFTLRS